jgi:hypothetical protein
LYSSPNSTRVVKEEEMDGARNMHGVQKMHTQFLWGIPFGKYSPGNQIEKNEMGEACGTYGGGKRCIQDFGRET